MWKLWNKLFGWHYVHMKNTATEEIRRVQVAPNGRRFVKYFSSYLISLDKEILGEQMYSGGWYITPLTFNWDD